MHSACGPPRVLALAGHAKRAVAALLVHVYVDGPSKPLMMEMEKETESMTASHIPGWAARFLCS
ncbi:hypothetical protein GCM10010206_51950 [Streptomyces cinerochromogenes]|nr:hypothetical protein GCM10010206_51950 [Streptomyces cinerochromogenes]